MMILWYYVSKARRKVVSDEPKRPTRHFSLLVHTSIIINIIDAITIQDYNNYINWNNGTTDDDDDDATRNDYGGVLSELF